MPEREQHPDMHANDPQPPDDDEGRQINIPGVIVLSL
jgi:hypothetical protein